LYQLLFGDMIFNVIFARCRPMLFVKTWGIGAAVFTLATPVFAEIQYSPETNLIVQRLLSDPRVPSVLQAIRKGYHPAPDLKAAVSRCVAAASLIPDTPVRLQVDACLRAMVGGLDPHSAYLSPQDFDRLTESRGEGTVGLEVRKSDLGAEIVSVMGGGPSAQAGIDAGTLIIAIDGKPTASMSLPEMASVLRGPVGSVASLEVMLWKSSEVLRLEVRRERIRQANITAKLIDGKLGYVRVPQLSASLSVELAEALQSLLVLQLQPVKGIIVDLRDCPGGLLHGAIALAAVFLPEDAVVMTVVSRLEGEQTYRASLSDASSKTFDPRPLLEDVTLRAAAQKIPLVVLVNHGTVSGAEVAVAALQEAGRAYVIGQATFGLSSFQTLLPMKDQYVLKLTTAVMSTASGKSWAGQGVQPDLAMPHVPAVRQNGKLTDDPWIKLAAEHLAKR
jgi:carboxyl-terminal processing protease